MCSLSFNGLGPEGAAALAPAIAANGSLTVLDISSNRIMPSNGWWCDVTGDACLRPAAGDYPRSCHWKEGSYYACDACYAAGLADRLLTKIDPFAGIHAISEALHVDSALTEVR